MAAKLDDGSRPRLRLAPNFCVTSQLPQSTQTRENLVCCFLTLFPALGDHLTVQHCPVADRAEEYPENTAHHRVGYVHPSSIRVEALDYWEAGPQRLGRLRHDTGVWLRVR